MLHDFEIFFQAGQALLRGESPYSVAGYFYPYPTTFIFALLAQLPFNWAAAVWLLASAAVLVLVTRRAAWLWFLFPPIIACFIQGQIDLFILGLWALAGGTTDGRRATDDGGAGIPPSVLCMPSAILPGMALALMTLKPQLAFILVPYQLWRWRHTRRWMSFAAALLLLYGLPTLIWPGWIADFLAHARPVSYAMTIAPSVFFLTQFSPWLLPVSLLLAAALLLWVLREGHGPAMVNAAALAVNPTTHVYDLALLADSALLWRTVALSWPLYLATLVFSNPETPFLTHAPFFVVPLVALWERARYAASGRVSLDSALFVDTPMRL